MYQRIESHKETIGNTQFRISTKVTLDKDYDEEEFEKKIISMMEKQTCS